MLRGCQLRNSQREISSIFSQGMYKGVKVACMKFFQVFLTLSLAPCLAPIPFLGQNSNAQPLQMPPGPPSASIAAPAVQEEVSARKKRFEEEKTKLENQSQPSSTADGCDESDLSISPNLVNMLVGETQGFSVHDLAGHKMNFRTEWSVSDSAVAELTVTDSRPVLTRKQIGSLRVTARVDTHSTEVIVNVIASEDMKPGTIRWQAPPIRCAQFLPRIPSGAPCTASELELAIVPRFFGIFVGRTKRFWLFDAEGHDLSSQADWSVDDVK